MRTMPPAFSWESQAKQYAYRDTPGINLERHHLGEFPDWTQIDCLLCRDENGLLIGILNYYLDSSNPLEQAGNVNVWVKPSHQRQGIATKLLLDALTRWDIDPNQQRYTEQGADWIAAVIKKVSAIKSTPGDQAVYDAVDRWSADQSESRG